VWNAAGTWEERTYSPWFVSRLTELLTPLVIQSNDYKVSVTEVTNITGDAQITMMRGKRKHIYDVSLEIKFTIESSTASTSSVAGSLLVQDITADLEYDFVFTIPNNSFASNLKSEIQKSVSKILALVDAEFKEK